MELRIALLDDNGYWLEKEKRIISEYLEKEGILFSVESFCSASELMSAKGYIPDVVFCDIELNDLESGIEIGKIINKRWAKCQIVYVTNYISYATDAYDTVHTYFVLKDKLTEYLDSLFGKLISGINQVKRHYTFRLIGHEGEIISIPESDILYMERNKRITRIVTIKGEWQTREKIEELWQRIDQSSFLRCHNSTIIYMPAIRRITKNEIQMNDGTVISISRSYRTSAMENFVNWAEQLSLTGQES